MEAIPISEAGARFAELVDRVAREHNASRSPATAAPT
jgi:antitoxin (DNA-binding transcriptional repressor) of toxin-antitoxin stability system